MEKEKNKFINFIEEKIVGKIFRIDDIVREINTFFDNYIGVYDEILPIYEIDNYRKIILVYWLKEFHITYEECKQKDNIIITGIRCY